MNAGTDFDERPDAAASPNMSLRWIGNAGHQLQRRRLPRTIGTDQTDRFAFLYFQRYISESERAGTAYVGSRAAPREGQRRSTQTSERFP